jgi:cytochrome c oxidase subunit 2
MNGSLGGSLPIPASALAHSWDQLYIALFYICVFFFVIVCASMLLFAIKYRARPGHKAQHITHNDALEFIWTAIPTVLVIGIFIWGWIVFRQFYVDIPSDAMEIKVVGQQWSWTFQYDDGRTLTNEVVVPKGKNIKFLITSKVNDVLHSFFIPNLRVKRDAVPGMYTTVWFNADTIGQHQIYCTEYCGTGHSDMLAKLIVLDEQQFNLWKWGAKVQYPPVLGPGGVSVPAPEITSQAVKQDNKNDSPMPPAMMGRRLATNKGCVACHSDDGSKRIGPSYKGLFGSTVELTNGKKVKADENYIRESILTPQVKIVKGFENAIMPPFAGQLDDSEVGALVEYIKSVR